MSEIYNAKEIDWTCPNCGHQSPSRTFSVIEKLEKKLKTATDALGEIQEYPDKYSELNHIVNVARQALKKIKVSDE
jgi:uncharacterized membrane protein YfbV (UPF0208 family)